MKKNILFKRMYMVSFLLTVAIYSVQASKRISVDPEPYFALYHQSHGMRTSTSSGFRDQSRVSPPAPCGAVPTENQLRWQDMEMYAFLHYSLNTYTDQEWGFGNESLSLFNPSQLDVHQWVKVCKQAGMRGIIFTAKHHNGFCMWPSAYTDYSVKNTPWKDGQGDVVGELADACREAGLKFAVYLSPWDRNRADYGTPEYVVYFRNQLRELLTQYGDVFEVWFDGANGGDGWYGGANETRRIDGRTYYEWAETFRMIRELQPNAVIWNDGGDRGDIRWVGTEAGNVGETNWSLLNREGDTDWGCFISVWSLVIRGCPVKPIPAFVPDGFITKRKTNI